MAASTNSEALTDDSPVGAQIEDEEPAIAAAPASRPLHAVPQRGDVLAAWR